MTFNIFTFNFYHNDIEKSYALRVMSYDLESLCSHTKKIAISFVKLTRLS